MEAALQSPLVAAKHPEAEPAVDNAALQVVVCSRLERPIGLIVDHILDVVEEDGAARGPSSRRAVEYTAVIQGRVTEMLDVDDLIRTAGEG